MSFEDFETDRCDRQAQMRAALAELGFTNGPSMFADIVKPKPAPNPRASRKRKVLDGERDAPASKVARSDASNEAPGLRRSQRNAGKKVDYKGDGSEFQERKLPRLASVQAGLREMDSEPRNTNKRIHDPKKFGAIPGIPVGTWWESREACSADAIHAPWVGGISGGSEGAYSVALSGGYPDDIDLGDAFTYTGSGGRDLKGTKAAPKNLRTGPQTHDQSFDHHFNKTLLVSSQTKKPVRVIRGFKLQSPYAPAEGYRYDGLYTIEKAWLAVGTEGFKVCKFAFTRLPSQAPLQVGQKKPSSDSQVATPETDN